VGIVTLPFSFEGKKRLEQAEHGLKELRRFCDTTLVISNDKVRELFGNLVFKDAFAKADDVLASAAKGIAEIITVDGYVNVDFADVRTVLQQSGKVRTAPWRPCAWPCPLLCSARTTYPVPAIF
jgi:cell division protein FtsZ